jgi:hypothetical protein
MSGAQLLVDFSNSLVFEFSGAGAGTNLSSSSLLVSLTQPLLRGAFARIVTQPLSLQERGVLYAIRDFSRFRRGFYVDVVAGNGFLDTPALDDTYPLLDPKAALTRVATGGIADDGREPMPAPAIATCLPEKPCFDSPAERVATAVRLGLMYAPSYDAKAVYLVPAWLLSFAGSDYPEPLMALPDRYLATPPPDTREPGVPMCDPAPCGVDVPPDGGVTGNGSSGSTGSSGSGGAPSS